MENNLEKIREKTLDEIKNVKTADELENIRTSILGRKGELTAILRTLGEMPADRRALIGKRSNEIKSELESIIDSRKVGLLNSKIDMLLKKDWLDVTLNRPDSTKTFQRGVLHPIFQTQYEMEDIFTSMGFEILDGPEVETEHYNFEVLNIPKHHPARDMQDTFWTEDGNLLRTHTSAIQVRGMERIKPPFRIVGPGRVFRYESTDASHENTFYQIEGMMVDREISIAHLINVMKELLKQIFKKEVTVRLRPAYYPFVEPGFDLDFNCLICRGKGCSVCKKSGWIEFLGCGLVHPNVLRAGNINPEEWSGFAFGMGINRLAMMRYGITDIRHFQSGDIRFIQQFC